MSPFLILFLILAVILVLMLAWGARPPKKVLLTPDDVFEALSNERHYARMPQILQSLREEDTEFMRERGRAELLRQVRRERTRIALRYLNYLQEEYQVLLEASRILATLAPELSALDEYERFKRNIRFAFCCRYLGWRLRLGLPPWEAFGTISDMAGEITLQLETAAARLGERALLAADYSSVLKERP
jgi:hypothetical protein